ncbi:hypothetical protein B2A_12610, partial [mine drainage metagenome]
PGSYSLAVQLPTNATFLSWTTQGGVSVAAPTTASTSLTVTGPGTVTALESAPALAVGAIVPSASTVPVSEPDTLNATVLSGPGPYAYRWIGCAGLGSTASVVCTPTVVGNFTIDVNVTDAFGDSMMAPPLVLHVVAGFSVAITASPSAVTLGNAVTFTTTASSGAAPFTYQYVGLPSGCGTPTTAAFRCTPTTAGSYPISVLVIDARGFRAVANLDFYVNP